MDNACKTALAYLLRKLRSAGFEMIAICFKADGFPAPRLFRIAWQNLRNLKMFLAHGYRVVNTNSHVKFKELIRLDSVATLLCY